MPFNRKQQTGFTLVEVLVATVILSVGLLGLAGMQAASMRYNHDAYLRSQAIAIANDILDRMRTNHDGVTAGSYNDVDSRNDPPDEQGCSGENFCNVAQIANQDIREWTDHFQDVYQLGTAYTPSLPVNSFGTVTNNAGTFTITITWTEIEAMHAGEGESAQKTFTIATVL